MSTAPTGRRRSPWLGVQGVCALLILVGTAAWRGTLLNGSYFNTQRMLLGYIWNAYRSGDSRDEHER